jgi:hypothetical protein
MRTRSLCLILISGFFLAFVVTPAGGVLPGAGFTFEAPVHIAIDTLSLDGLPLYATLTNTGDSADAFQFVLERDLPDTSWSALLCIKGMCLPPWISTAVETLGVGQSDTLVDVTIISKKFGAPEVEGAGYTSLTVTSMRDPSLVATVHFTFISEGVEVLIVDDDGEADYEQYYEDAIGTRSIQGIWHRSDQAPTQDDLSHFDALVWETGDERSTLDEEDREALAGYLDSGDSGKRLFVSGQDIGFSLADPASPDYSDESLSFFTTYLHANYVSDNAADHSLSGIAGDPISDGLSLVIEGGDGANNQTSPDVVAPRAPAASMFEYDPGIAGAVRAETQGHKVVFMSFGFEAVNSQVTREELMDRTLDWLLAPIGIEGDGPASPLPRQIGLSQNFPNPFNPSTAIAVEVPGAEGERVNAALTIYSQRGRVVRTLHQGKITAGAHRFTWDGRDDAGLEVPGGVYLYCLSSRESVITKKMLLMK